MEFARLQHPLHILPMSPTKNGLTLHPLANLNHLQPFNSPLTTVATAHRTSRFLIVHHPSPSR